MPIPPVLPTPADRALQTYTADADLSGAEGAALAASELAARAAFEAAVQALTHDTAGLGTVFVRFLNLHAANSAARSYALRASAARERLQLRARRVLAPSGPSLDIFATIAAMIPGIIRDSASEDEGAAEARRQAYIASGTAGYFTP